MIEDVFQVAHAFLEKTTCFSPVGYDEGSILSTKDLCQSSDSHHSFTFLLNNLSITRAMAPSPVTLQAVPKLSMVM